MNLIILFLLKHFNLLNLILLLIQPGGGPPGGFPNGPPWNPWDPEIPITGSAIYLLAAAIGLGIRVYTNKKSKN